MTFLFAAGWVGSGNEPDVSRRYPGCRGIYACSALQPRQRVPDCT